MLTHCPCSPSLNGQLPLLERRFFQSREGLKVGWPFVAKLFVGGFHYRNKTLTKVGCMFVLFHLSPCGTCGVWERERASQVMIYWFLSTSGWRRLLANHPWWRAGRKRHARHLCMPTNTPSRPSAPHRAAHNSEHRKRNWLLVKAALLAEVLPLLARRSSPAFH